MDNPIFRNIPNTITCCNLLSGAAAVYFAFQPSYVMAFTFIIMGAVFDFFDGFSARLLHVSSAIGKELDSLADCITFGMAPAAIVFSFLSEFDVCNSGLMRLLPFIAFLIAAFSALRLAKFNLDTRQTTSFIGLPTPANALFWGALVISTRTSLRDTTWGLLLVLALVLITCILLVSELPMFALKFKNFSFRDNRIRFLFLLGAVALIVGFAFCKSGLMGVWLSIVWYILLSVLTRKS